ncbi:hypothetical protein H8F21_14555 [Pseudomonas sp. P66]|uniref:TraG P-loop domain-containing protein n=1 Tax=Pseudomonas arcuscaelestis TaxID=2710591 RepID=A0ABS2BYT9_9PSED|nr:FtsK/SpoIIIE domain-containing protein [Pseudomonas arcuscaelestis]MBM5458786.1 hypothetical protein [Pseudomonas arcuscaelestis]
MAEKQNLHLFDSELAGLGRRNYQGGMPIQLLSDAFLYEAQGRYFHTLDGRFAKIWKISGIDASMLNNEGLFDVTGCFADILNKYPAGSTGQHIRHTHRDIRSILGVYQDQIDPEAGEFAAEIARSIMSRQFKAAVSSNGFFGDASEATINQMKADALAELGDETDEDVRATASEAIKREVREGRFPHVSDFYIVFMWEPEYIFGKFFDNTVKACLAAVGLADANKMAERSYNGHAKIFGQHCTEIEQALATYNFNPEVLTGQGYLNLHYALMNPVRSFEIEPPKYRADIPILEALSNPNIVETRDNLAATATFAHVQTETDGWTIHDRNVPYYIRPVSVMGKPIRSTPGMLQTAMAGIESESLVTMNWSIPRPVVVASRLAIRGRMIAAKESMRVGDRETRDRQRADLDAVRNKVSSENASNREQFFDLSVHINLMGFNKDIIDDQAMALERRLWRIGHKEMLRGDAVVRNSMPFNFRTTSMKMLKRSIPHLTESVSHMAPLFVEYQGVADPAILMNNRAGQPIFLDLWGHNVNTAHSLICGTTGSGKSFTFNNLLMALRVKYRPKVWIIDKGDSYESLCLVLNGNYVRLTTESFVEPVSGRTIDPICINPFALKKDENGRHELPELDEKFFVARMLIMMMEAGDGSGTTKSNLTKVTTSLLYQALDDFYRDWVETRPMDEPRFRDFIPYLIDTDFEEQKGKVLAENLTLYYGNGPFAAIFDGYLDVDWENDFTVLETQRMSKSPALGVVTLALFRQIDLYCKFKLQRSRKKVVAVDEAWATLSDPNAAKALSSFYRELRRYGAGCLLISQTVKDFVNLIKAETSGGGDSQDGILENTSHYFFLACSESDYRVAKEELAFSDEEIDLWRSLASLPPMYSEVFYRMRTSQSLYYSGVFRLFSAPMTLWIASSHPDDYNMRELKAKELVETLRLEPSDARQKAIIELSKTHPFGARYGQVV